MSKNNYISPIWPCARLYKTELKIAWFLNFRVYSLIEKNGSNRSIGYKYNWTIMPIKALTGIKKLCLPYILH